MGKQMLKKVFVCPFSIYLYYCKVKFLYFINNCYLNIAIICIFAEKFNPKNNSFILLCI